MAMKKLPAIIQRYDRKTFIDEVWDYSPGEHVTTLAPTGWGKTQLSFELLGATANPDNQAVVFVMKPRDATVDKFAAKYGYKIIRDWPVPRHRVWEKKPPGYILWPKETGDPDIDDVKHEAIFRRAARDIYRRGNKILFADETYSLEKELGMERELRRLWTKGRSMKAGLWASSQRPVWISLWAYQAHHLFLGNDPDAGARKRYGEIGAGFDPETIREVTSQLDQYQFLYISREEKAMCIVDR